MHLGGRGRPRALLGDCAVRIPYGLRQETELLAAGFPCIDVSRAGLRKGLEGRSTGLVRHVFRLLRRARDAKRPVPWVLLENVCCSGEGMCISWGQGLWRFLDVWRRRVACVWSSGLDVQ